MNPLTHVSLLSMLVLSACAPSFAGNWSGDATEQQTCTGFGYGDGQTTSGTIPMRWSIVGGDPTLSISITGMPCGLTEGVPQVDGTYAIPDVICDVSQSSLIVKRLSVINGVLGIADDGLLRFSYKATRTEAWDAVKPPTSTCIADTSGALTRE